MSASKYPINGQQYPEGKLNEHDEGQLQVAVGVENGRVVIGFGKRVEWVGFSPDQAAHIAALLLKHAKTIGLTKPFTLEL